jgi:hypothetical protein
MLLAGQRPGQVVRLGGRIPLAPPSLKQAPLDRDRGVRVQVGRAVWLIDHQLRAAVRDPLSCARDCENRRTSGDARSIAAGSGNPRHQRNRARNPSASPHHTGPGSRTGTIRGKMAVCHAQRHPTGASPVKAIQGASPCFPSLNRIRVPSH